VWKDSRILGQAAGESAVQMCGGVTRDQVTGAGVPAGRFMTPGGNNVSAILLQPQPINVSDLNVVLDAGWIPRSTLCQGVPANSVAVCS
jgi:D-xylose transport system substrate-binding protein